MNDNKKPLVSVLMTAYNRERYIGEAIQCVINQSYDNWELIITDDQSKDSTLKIANEYAQQDMRIKVFRNEENLGDYPNRNMAASYAQGKYLKYLDSDDLMYPWALEIMVNLMEQNPQAQWGLCSMPQNPFKLYPYVLHPTEIYKANYFDKIPIFSRAPLSAIITKKAFNEVGGFSGKQHLGDFEMWHILGRYYPLLLMPKGMVWYREHEDQQMNDNRIDLFVPFKYLINAKENISHIDCPLSNNDKEKILKDINYRICTTIVRTLCKRKFSKVNQMLQASGVSLFTAFVHVLKK